MNIDIILDNQPLDTKYYPGRGPITAYCHAVRCSVISYCIKHGKKIPSSRTINEMANKVCSYHKKNFYTRYEMSRVKNDIKEINIKMDKIQNKLDLLN